MNVNLGFRFTLKSNEQKSPFDRLYDVFQELITHTSGDVEEAVDWLRELDKEYELTDDTYSIDDFIRDLLDKGLLSEEIDPQDDNNGSSDSLTRNLKATAKYAMAIYWI